MQQLQENQWHTIHHYSHRWDLTPWDLHSTEPVTLMPHATTFKATIGSFNASMKAMIGSFNASIPKIRIWEYKKQGTHKLVHFSHSHIELYRSPLGIHTTEPSGLTSTPRHGANWASHNPATTHTDLFASMQRSTPTQNRDGSSFIFFFSVTPDLVAVFPSLRVHHNTGTNLGVLHQVPTTQHQIAQYALHLALKQLGSPL